jgi:enoyl reductase-like protein
MKDCFVAWVWGLVFLAVLPVARAEELGQCIGLVQIPARFESRTEQVEVKPAQERVLAGSRYEWVWEAVSLPAGKVRKVVKPAEYRLETVTVAGRNRFQNTPARYKTVTEESITKRGTVAKVDPDKAAICQVEVPTEFRIQEKKVLVAPAQSRIIAGQARQVQRKVLVKPAETVWVDAPARTVKRRVKRAVEGGQQTVLEPAVFETVTHRTMIEPAHAEWQPVLCDTNATPDRIRALQTALKNQGWYNGAINGVLNRATQQAVVAFQKKESLPTPLITLETLARLGVPL